MPSRRATSPAPSPSACRVSPMRRSRMPTRPDACTSPPRTATAPRSRRCPPSSARATTCSRASAASRASPRSPATPTSCSKIAEQRADEAAAAQERADTAWAAIDLVPVEDLEDAVADAEAALADAKQELADLQADATTRSRLASSSVSLIASLPTDAGQLSDQGWALPVAGRITDGFGPRPVKPLAGVNEFHRGTDLAAACQSPVFAATSGVVVERRAERKPRQLDPRRSRVRRRDGLRRTSSPTASSSPRARR